MVNFLEAQHDRVISKFFSNKVCYIGTASNYLNEAFSTYKVSKNVDFLDDV